MWPGLIKTHLPSFSEHLFMDSGSTRGKSQYARKKLGIKCRSPFQPLHIHNIASSFASSFASCQTHNRDLGSHDLVHNNKSSKSYVFFDSTKKEILACVICPKLLAVSSICLQLARPCNVQYVEFAKQAKVLNSEYQAYLLQIEARSDFGKEK